MEVLVGSKDTRETSRVFQRFLLFARNIEHLPITTRLILYIQSLRSTKIQTSTLIKYLSMLTAACSREMGALDTQLLSDYRKGLLGLAIDETAEQAIPFKSEQMKQLLEMIVDTRLRVIMKLYRVAAARYDDLQKLSHRRIITTKDPDRWILNLDGITKVCQRTTWRADHYVAVPADWEMQQWYAALPKDPSSLVTEMTEKEFLDTLNLIQPTPGYTQQGQSRFTLHSIKQGALQDAGDYLIRIAHPDPGKIISRVARHKEPVFISLPPQTVRYLRDKDVVGRMNQTFETATFLLQSISVEKHHTQRFLHPTSD